MNKIVKTEAKNASVQIEAPVVLTPEQITEIAAGFAATVVVHTGPTTTYGLAPNVK